MVDFYRACGIQIVLGLCLVTPGLAQVEVQASEASERLRFTGANQFKGDRVFHPNAVGNKVRTRN